MRAATDFVRRLTPDSSAPEVVGQVDYDWVGRAADDDPAEGFLLGQINLHVRREGRDVEEVSGADPRFGFAALAPADERFAFEHIDDGFLLAVMVDAGTRAGFDEERPAPEAGGDAVVARNGGEAL